MKNANPFTETSTHGALRKKENAPREKKTILNEEKFRQLQENVQAYWQKNEDYFNTTFEAEDNLHEIDPSPSYGEKKANYTRFFIGNEKHG